MTTATRRGRRVRRVRRSLAPALVMVVGVLVGTVSCSRDSSAPSTSPVNAPTTPVGEAALPAELTQQLQASLDASLPDLGGAPGALAAVWRPGTGTWAGATGAADLAGTRRLGTDDHLRVGDVTTTFTVVAALRLVDQGKLGLDDPVSQWLPEIAGADRITVRMLAGMTSGLASATTGDVFFQGLCSDPQHVYGPDDLLREGAARPRTGEPGQAVAYDLTNPIALGLIVEKVTGRPLGDELAATLIDPLGLGGTRLPAPDDAALPEPRARGITSKGTCTQVDATDWNPSWTSFGGAMTSTLTDLEVWTLALGTGRLLSPATFAAQTEFRRDPGAPAYGLGLADFDGWWGHNGSIPGYTVAVRYQPRTKVVVVVVAMSDQTPGGQSPASVLLADVLAVVDGSVLLTPPSAG